MATMPWANSAAWVQLLVFLVIILAINVFALREGFNVTNPFSQFLESLITIDPDHLWSGHNGSGNWHDSSGNWHDSSGNCQNRSDRDHEDHEAKERAEKAAQDQAAQIAAQADQTAAHASAEKTFYNTLKADINEAIKNELTSEYNLHHPIVTNSNATSTTCTAQGKEMLDKNKKDCPQNAQPIDMSTYIRKDSIPCWGCSI